MSATTQVPTKAASAGWAVALGAALGVMHRAEYGLAVGSALLVLTLAKRRRNLSLQEAVTLALVGVLVVVGSLLIRDWDAFKAGLAGGSLGH